MEKFNYSLGDAIRYSVSEYAQLPAVGFINEAPLSYSEFLVQIENTTRLLVSLGISKGDKVAILSANQPNWGVAFFAITGMGAISVPLLPDFHSNEIANILNHSEAKAIFVSEALHRKIVGSELPLLKIKVNIDDMSVIEGEKGDLVIPMSLEMVSPDDLASIIYTSGTTGKSKGVMLSHRNLIFDAIQASTIHKIVPGDRMLSILPLSHAYENTIAFILPLISGASITYLKKPPTPSVLLPALQKVRPTVMLSVPLIIEKVYRGKVLADINSKAITRTLYKFRPTQKLLNRIAGKKVYESFGGQLVFFGIGGAKLDPQVEQFLIDGKFPYAIGYGLTETGPLLAGFDSFQGKYQSTGPVMQGVTLKINDPDKVTGEGEIWAKGDNVMKGYFKEPEITREVLTEDGWFKTGDLGVFDKSGFLFIKGRLKNMIVGASGENIYPEEIEAIINRFQYVLESLVVQKKGKLVAMVHFNMDELEKKYQHMREQANQLIDKKIEELLIELQLYVNARVNKFSRVQLVVAHAEPFEKTATKKIKRFLYY